MHRLNHETCVTAELAQWAHQIAKLALQMDDLVVEIVAARILDAFASHEEVPVELIERAERFVTDNNLKEVIEHRQPVT